MRTGALRVWFATLCLGVCGAALALEPEAMRFRRYDVDAGLSNNTVRAIGQDGDGYIWVATRDGLNRFDGHAFRIYRSNRDDPHSLPDNDVRALGTSPEGELWIGTAGGLARYDARLDRFDRYRSGTDTGLASNTIRALHFDARGELWVSCSPIGVQRFDPALGRARDAPFGRPVALRSVYSYLDLPDGQMMFAGGGNLWRWDGRSARVDPLVSDAASVFPTAFELAARDRHDELWVGFLAGGLIRLASDGRVLARFRTGEPGALQSGDVSGLLEAHDGRLWITTAGGVAIYENQRFVERLHDRSDPTSPPEQPIAPFEDRDGLIWIGSWQGGVAVHDPQTQAVRQYQQRLPVSQGLPSNLVRAVLTEADGSLWLALGGAGLVHFAPGQGVLAQFRHAAGDPNSLASDDPAALARARDGTLWIGHNATGLDRLAPGATRFEHFRHARDDPTSLPFDLINSLHVAEDGALIVGSDGGGAARLCPGCTQFERFGDALQTPLESAATINAIAVPPDGSLWLGSYGRGLLRLRTGIGAVERFALDAGNEAPSNDVVRTLRVDHGGRLWVGTANGLDRVELDAEARVHFVHHRGPEWAGKSNITCIVEDARGVLWLGTSAGLFRFDPDRGEIASSSVLGRLDRGGYLPNACAQHDGALYFGGARGLTVFSPDRLPPEPAVGPLVLDELFLFNTPLRPQPEAAQPVLAQSLSRTERLRFDHRQDTFGFSFAALDFRDPEGVRYRYRLDGVNEDWLPVSAGQRYIGFSGLREGDYVLRVEASRGASRSEASVALTVLPPPWRTAWAYAAYAFAALAFIALVFWRTRARLLHERDVAASLRRSEEALRRLNEELEQRVAARTSDLSASNDELTQTLERLRETQQQLVEAEKLASLGGLVAGVAHEINTPLGVSVTAASFLQGETQRVRQRLAAGPLGAGDLTTFAKTASDSVELLLRNLQQAARLVQSFKRVAVEESSELHRVVDLGVCLQDIVATLGPSLRQTPHRVVLETGEPMSVRTAPGALFQVVTNLVANALLHAFDAQRPGTIRIALVREPDAVLLDIADDGRGMSEVERAHLFEPFFTTKRGQGGTGLGLHIVYTLVTQALKGRIRCESAPGQGTRFEIRLPL